MDSDWPQGPGYTCEEVYSIQVQVPVPCVDESSAGFWPRSAWSECAVRGLSTRFSSVVKNVAAGVLAVHSLVPHGLESEFTGFHVFKMKSINSLQLSFCVSSLVFAQSGYQ